MGEWSPECVGAAWLDGATGPVVGARFQGRNRHGRARWANKPRIVAADRPNEFGFVANTPFGRDMTRWTYRFAALGSETEVTESWELLHDLPLYLSLSDRFIMGVHDREADLAANMRETLTRIRDAAEGRTRTSSSD